jgi:hypothetical protein
LRINLILSSVDESIFILSSKDESISTVSSTDESISTVSSTDESIKILSSVNDKNNKEVALRTKKLALVRHLFRAQNTLTICN